jgi:hypothetical protein
VRKQFSEIAQALLLPLRRKATRVNSLDTLRDGL